MIFSLVGVKLQILRDFSMLITVNRLSTRHDRVIRGSAGNAANRRNTILQHKLWNIFEARSIRRVHEKQSISRLER